MTNAEKVLNNQAFLTGIKKIKKELMSIQNSAWDNRTLCGACAFGAYLVFVLAQELGLQASFRMGSGKDQWFEHCWCLIDDVVVDITAKQFLQLHPYLNDDILISENENIYQQIGLKLENEAFIDEDIFALTEGWDEQGVKDLSYKFSDRICAVLGINLPVPQIADYTE